MANQDNERSRAILLYRAMRVYDALRNRPVYFKDGSKLELIGKASSGLLRIVRNGGEEHFIALEQLGYDFQGVDWIKTDDV